MKQILQSLKNGETEIADVPIPLRAEGHNLIQTSKSLVSVGTERMLVQFGKGNLINKARSQPEKVKMVFEKAKVDGVFATLDAVSSKLDQPLALGYCNVGKIVDASGNDFAIGDRIASNGKHAETVSVAKNLCAKIPDNVTDEEAAFTVVSAIGLQGIRLANPTIGEAFVVTGLGLIGLLTVQMLVAQGCRVLGVDFNQERLELARTFGAEICNLGTGQDLISKAKAFSRGVGVDAVIITAATSSNQPISQSAKICRQRGRIILVGIVGLELNRADFYEKELSFQVSCSYGPGRYDNSYEELGQDYPIGFVRWTENRNFQAVLDMMSRGLLNVEPLITHRFKISEGAKAMGILSSKASALGILIDYPDREDLESSAVSLPIHSEKRFAYKAGAGRIAFIGAGNYAGRTLIPAFKFNKANLDSIVSSQGVSSLHFGRKFGFKIASTDFMEILSRSEINTVVIVTRHDLHANQILEALRAGKNIFCEKPLCLTLDELAEIEKKALELPAQKIVVGFNRRFAPMVIKMKELLGTIVEPKSIIITVNAGFIPSDNWVQDPLVGGGRIIGECCHFIDLARHLAGSKIVIKRVQSLGWSEAIEVRDDKVTITLKFEDGSFASINYLANGHRSFPKERIEVFAGGKVLQLDNYRLLRGWGFNNFSSMRRFRQDKGQRNIVSAFLKSIEGDAVEPIPIEEIFEVSRASIQLAENARR